METTGPQPPVVQEASDERRSRRVVGTLILAIVAALIIWWLLEHIAVVPNTIGMTQGHARDLIGAAGFESVTSTKTIQSAQPGRVVGQSPVGGLRFTWRPVTLAISSATGVGEEEVTISWEVPPTGYKTAVGEVAVASEVLPSDAEEVAPLFVPTGASERRMPNILYMSRSQALDALGRVGVLAKFYKGPSTTDVPGGRVFYQSPEPGTGLRGTPTSVVWLSTGPLDIAKGMSGSSYPRPGHPVR